MKPRSLISLILSVLLLASSLVAALSLLQAPIAAQGSDWLEGWFYRKEHRIVGSTAGAVTDYQIRIKVHYGSGTDDGENVYLEGKCRADFGDVRFTAGDGVTPLSYWMEKKVDGEYAIFWVKVPYIPAYPGSTTIYIYYSNPDATRADNPLEVGIWQVREHKTYDAYNPDITFSKPTNTTIRIYSTSSSIGAGYLFIVAPKSHLHGKKIQICWQLSTDGTTEESDVYILDAEFHRESVPSASYIIVFGRRSSSIETSGVLDLSSFTSDYVTLIIRQRDLWDGDYFTLDVDWLKILDANDNVLFTYDFEEALIMEVTGTYNDYGIVRKYVEPEPSHGAWGKEESPVISLPDDAVLVRHSLSYSPSSTQFLHAFSALNETAAGYEASYGGDAWAWRVWADPCYANGTPSENHATLVSNVTIALPYSPTKALNLTLWAKAGAPSYRLWVRVLDGGNVIGEVENATVGADWTPVSIPLNVNLTSATIWINATVSASAEQGGELAIKGVKLWATYTSTAASYAIGQGDIYNATTRFTVSLTDFLNSSTLDLLVRDRLAFNGTTYPIAPVCVGDEAVNNKVYRVYRIEGAVYDGTYYARATLENVLAGARIRSRGVEVLSALVGEPVTVELPKAANVTIKKTGTRYENVENITLIFLQADTYTIDANITKPQELVFGFKGMMLRVGYGALTVKPIDVDGSPIDYETLAISMKNLDTGESRTMSVEASVTLTGLTHGLHALSPSIKGVAVAAETIVDLWIGTNGSTVAIPCAVRRLPADYRGLDRAVAFEHDKQLQVEDLSPKFPLSRMRILLNGTGSFRVSVNYRGDLPTKVAVTGNATGLEYYWDGSYLVITGSLGSVGEVNITDLYRLRIELYDRLGNRLPIGPVVLINGTGYAGPTVEDYLYPDDYVIEVPAAADGFDFYSFFDGYNATTRTITLTDDPITLKAWYRVPVTASVGGVRVGTTWWPSLIPISQDDERVSVYFEIRLRDYYGEAVPNRPVLVKVIPEGMETGWLLNLTTDPSGYAQTPPVRLLKHRNYLVEVEFAGDDIYVGAKESLQIAGAELPELPAESPAGPSYLLMLIPIGLAVALAIAVVKLRHVLPDGRRRRALREVGWINEAGQQVRLTNV